jgi:hypothetical protein
MAVLGMRHAIFCVDGADKIFGVRALQALRKIYPAENFRGTRRRETEIALAIFARADLPVSAMPQPIFFNAAEEGRQGRGSTVCKWRTSHGSLAAIFKFRNVKGSRE